MRYVTLAAVFVLLNLADCVTTFWILEGGGREVNPLMAVAWGLGLVPFVVIKALGGAAAALIFLKHNPKVLLVLTPLMTLPVVWNLAQLLLRHP